MKELEEMKEVFNIFVDSCEKAGVKFSKEEKQVEEWPKANDYFWYRDCDGNVMGEKFTCHKYDLFKLANLLIFKTKESCEKYYSIVDTINETVGKLGRPSWDEMADNCIMLQGACYNFKAKCFHSITSSIVYNSGSFFPYCKKPYLEKLLEKMSENDLLWAFKKSMRLA